MSNDLKEDIRTASIKVNDYKKVKTDEQCRIESLEEQVRVLYNVVVELMRDLDQWDTASHLASNIMFHLDLKEITKEELEEMGRC